MTTINEMLEQGIEFHGLVKVTRYDNAKAEWVTVLDPEDVNGPIVAYVDEPWADVNISYMYAKRDGNDCVMFIEVDGGDEWTREADEVWACADCADMYEPEAGPILEYENVWWTCPKCGCTTCAPEEDACYRIG